MAKFLEAPSILAKYAKGDILLPALLHFLLQTLVLLAVLWSATSSERTLRERLESALGKGVFVLYIFYALYFLFSAILPLLDFEKFVYAVFFDTAPTTFSFAFFFFFSAYACTKGIKAVGRSADLCLFLFLFPFLALLIMAFVASDFSHLLPLFGTDFSSAMGGFTRTAPHFSDVALLLPLLINCRFKKGDGVKVVTGYWTGCLFTALFLATFFAVYSSIAPREHYAFSKIAQYFPALSIVGRVDLIFVYLLSVVLLFYTCLPLQYTTGLVARTIGIKRKTWISALLNFSLFLAILFWNKHYDAFYEIIGGKLFPVFWLFSTLLPPFLLFLPKNSPVKGDVSPRENTLNEKEKKNA